MNQCKKSHYAYKTTTEPRYTLIYLLSNFNLATSYYISIIMTSNKYKRKKL